MNCGDILKKIDVYFAAIGIVCSLVFSLFIIIFTHTTTVIRYIEAPAFILLFSIYYILIGKKDDIINQLSNLDEMNINRVLIFILNITFFTLFFCSILSIATRTEHYSRPFIYFILITLIVCETSIEIFYFPSTKGYVYFLLFKIMLIVLNLRWTSQSIFPGLIGIDPWWHQMFTMKIIEQGYIPESQAYSKFPIMHLIIGTTSLMTSFGYKISSMICGSFSQFISLVFLHLLGKLIYTEKIGLMAALLLGIADIQIQYTIVTIPMTFGVVFISITIFTIFKGKKITDVL